MSLKYRTHVNEVGWQDKTFTDWEIAGTLGECKAIEAIEINLDMDEINSQAPMLGIEAPVNLGVTYQVHVSDIGWMDPVINGQTAGTTGQAKQIECIIIDLFGEDKDKFDIWYHGHVQDLGWLDWTKNGEKCGTEGGGKRLEAIQIVVCRKDSLWLGSDQAFASTVFEPKPVEQPQPQQSAESAESKRARVVEIMQSYVGYKAGANNYSIFGDRHGDPNGDWCAWTVLSAFEDAGLADLVPPSGYVPAVEEWFLAHPTAKYYKKSKYNYIPKNGDIVHFDYNGNGTPDHTGIVEGCDGSTVCSLEGNAGSPRMVRRRYYSINSSDIYGYCVPNY